MKDNANSLWADRIIKAAGILPAEHLLDIGGGDGALSTLIRAASGAVCTVVDPHPRSPQHIAGRAESLPFAADEFDIVLMSHVAHHFNRPVVAMREAFRVLNPNGRLVVRTSSHSDLKHNPAAAWNPDGFEVLLEPLPDAGRIATWMRRAGFRSPCIERYETPFKGNYEEFVRGTLHIILRAWSLSGCIEPYPYDDAEAWLRKTYPKKSPIHETLLLMRKPARSAP